MRSLVLLWIVFPISLNAQILTSEVKVEQTNNLTTINGKTIIKGTASSNGLKIGGKYILEEGRNYSGIDLDLVNADYNAIRGYRDQTNIGTIHFFDTSWRSGSPSFSAGSLNLWGTTAVTIGQWDDPAAYFRRSDGYVGIGTVSPSEKLTVEGISSLKGIKIPNKVALNSGHHESAIELGIEVGNWNAIRGYQGDINIGTIHFFDDSWGGGAPINSAGSINLKGSKAVTIGLWNNPSIYVRHEDGFVGVGTVNPTERLHVNGNIRATAPVWSDFVFEKS
ncbi:hypothetical protein DSM03_1177 [Leeuwenhoekiella aestuarii]|uniref:hypothetical protein n=1 Tax=Leeuwenhoekiella aestuarii TaxID=2249426 RepID=UPI000FFEC94B|nr:hypothetical protein [Leeuwenhoekiella aestuarii]RXG11370.1 hypothetical protein DSM03_1177 [Leeuwenhoekiella aestuarii]